jgi:hypothetical protein
MKAAANPGTHRGLETVDHLAAFNQNGQIGGAVTHGGRQVGGFKADDGDQVSGAGSIGSGWLAL